MKTFITVHFFFSVSEIGEFFKAFLNVDKNKKKWQFPFWIKNPFSKAFLNVGKEKIWKFSFSINECSTENIYKVVIER